MAGLSWTPEIAVDFESRGDLRDIVVVGREARDWPAIHQLLTRWSPPAIFTFDGQVRPLPDSTAAICALHSIEHTIIAFDVEGLEFRCHVFSEDEFEFTLNPLEVTDDRSLGAVSDFMRKLMLATGKPVVLT